MLLGKWRKVKLLKTYFALFGCQLFLFFFSINDQLFKRIIRSARSVYMGNYRTNVWARWGSQVVLLNDLMGEQNFFNLRTIFVMGILVHKYAIGYVNSMCKSGEGDSPFFSARSWQPLSKTWISNLHMQIVRT